MPAQPGACLSRSHSAPPAIRSREHTLPDVADTAPDALRASSPQGLGPFPPRLECRTRPAPSADTKSASAACEGAPRGLPRQPPTRDRDAPMSSHLPAQRPDGPASTPTPRDRQRAPRCNGATPGGIAGTGHRDRIIDAPAALAFAWPGAAFTAPASRIGQGSSIRRLKGRGDGPAARHEGPAGASAGAGPRARPRGYGGWIGAMESAASGPHAANRSQQANQ